MMPITNATRPAPPRLLASLRASATGALPLALLLCVGAPDTLAADDDAVASAASGTPLRVVQVETNPAAALLEFTPAAPGLRYTVESSPNLAAGTWSALKADTVTANGSNWTCVDAAAEGASRFYRLRISHQSPETIDIRTQQPRLFWSTRIAANVYHADKTADFDDFFGNVHKKMHHLPATPAALDVAAIDAEMRAMVANISNGSFFRPAMDYGLCAFLSQDTADANAPAYRAYAESFLKALCARQLPCLPGADDLGPREKLYAMGVLYDWLRLDSSTTLGATVHEQTLNLIGAIDKAWGYFSQPYDSGGHERYANECALAALLAIHHGITAETRQDLRDSYFKWLGTIVRNWRERFNPTQAWMSGDSGHGMGWAYGPEYTTIEPAVMWDNATGEERWTGDWLRQRALFQVYGARNKANDETVRNNQAYGTFPYSGDAFSTAFFIPNHGAHLLLGDSPAGLWLYEQLASKYRYNYWPHLLYYDPSARPVSPADLDLPLARTFGVAGYVLMRDNWDLTKNTLLEFKSSSYYHGNHHHRDQNAFTIFFRGPLAIDSGAYQIFGRYGSPHEVNYYRRSLAHNTILVYDEDEAFVCDGKEYGNDGGQKFATGSMSEYPTLAQMQPGGANALDGIRAFENHPDFAYALGDATKAYSPEKLSDFRRSIVYLRNFAGTHPVIVVHDRVVSTDPKFTKTYLLHSINEPQHTAQTRRVDISIDEGTGDKLPAGLIQETVLPIDATITTVGGSGHEFWVAADGASTVTGYNYDDNKSAGDDDEALREAGNWRVEVKPGASREADSFLHVLTVAESAAPGAAVATRLPSTADADAVIVRSPGASATTPGTCLLFRHGSAVTDITLDLQGAPPIGRLIAVGLPRDTTVYLNKSATSLRLSRSAGLPLLTSDQGVLVATW